MDPRLDKLDEKLDKLLEIQQEMQIDIATHIKRTEIAEQNIEKLAEAMQPVQRHVALIQGVGQLIAWGLGIIAAIATTYAAFRQ